MAFMLINDALYAINDAGATTHRHDAIGTRIVQALPLGSRVIVLEDYYRFPRDLSNLYCLDSSLRSVWSVKRVTTTDAYVGPLEERDGNLRCGSWEGWSCTIDPATGNVLEQVFAK
jgi:hypothetical protein